MGNGFGFPLKKLSEPESSDSRFCAAKNFTLREAMQFFWNAHRLSFSGSLGVDYRDSLFQNQSFDFSTEYEESELDGQGYFTKIKFEPAGNFLAEPLLRSNQSFFMSGADGIQEIAIKGPYLNDVDPAISSQNIFGAIYAFKISVDMTSNGELNASTKSPGNGYVLRQTFQASFLGKAFPIYVSTRFNEYITPGYNFSMSPISAQNYTAADY
ncbi:MAG: hypothetical protein J6T16_06385, partial [Opitutales bacterium]|nr:hypothetical protein [Opitutales bacterium]